VLFPKRYHLLPYLIFFSFMKPDQYLHWTAFGLLVFLLQSKEEWNLRVLPCILLAILPSLYLSQISWSLALSVLLSFPLGIRQDWINQKQLWFIAPLVFAFLAFFSGPLAPWMLLLALALYLPLRKASVAMLVFLLLWVLPLGRSDWKNWLGQVNPKSASIITPSSPPAQSEPVPSQNSSSSMANSSSRIESILISLFQYLLFAMFALLLVLLLRLLYLMRKNKKPMIQGVFLFSLLIVSALVSIFSFRWLDQLLAQRAFHDPSLPPLLQNPQSRIPLPGSPPTPLPKIPPDLPSETLSPSFLLRDLLSYAITILFLLLLCFMLFKALRTLWNIPSLSDADTNPEDTPQKSASPSPASDWSSYQGAELIKLGYETLRKKNYPHYAHLTPLELQQIQNQEEFRQLTQSYITVSYARSQPKINDQVILQWLEKCLHKI